MSNKIYYKKLCCADENSGRSISGVSEFEVRYEIGKWSKPLPNTGGLYVFETLEDAQNFQFGSSIWECVVKNPRKVKYIGDVMGCNYSSYTISHFWEFVLKKKRVSDTNYCTEAPNGTILCDAVKITKRID